MSSCCVLEGRWDIVSEMWALDCFMKESGFPNWISMEAVILDVWCDLWICEGRGIAVGS